MINQIQQTSKQLLDSFEGHSTCASLLLDTNVVIPHIIDLICSETHFKRVSNLENAYSPNRQIPPAEFTPTELKAIIRSFILGENYNFIPHLGYPNSQNLSTNFLVDNNGKFFPVIPHLSFFSSSLSSTDDKDRNLKSFQKKVLKPYAKRIAKGKPLSDRFLEKMKSHIKKILDSTPAPDNSDINSRYAEYMVSSMFNSPDFIINIKQAAFSKPSSSIFFGAPTQSSAIFEALSQQFSSLTFNKNYVETILANVNQLYYATHATLKCLSTDLASLSPEEFEQNLITLNDILLADLSPEKSYHRPGKYREHDVTVGASDDSLGKRLVLNANSPENFTYGFNDKVSSQISHAMNLLANEIASLAQNANRTPLPQYINSIAQVFFKYISIHPFSDGNGRTGRMIINMLLTQKGIILDLSTSGAKKECINIMDEIEKSILSQTDSKTFLSDLQTSNTAIDTPAIESLANFLAHNSAIPGQINMRNVVNAEPEEGQNLRVCNPAEILGIFLELDT